MSGENKTLPVYLPVPKTDLVPAYYDGQAQDGVPAEMILRAEAHEQKKLGNGYFARNGTVFQFIAPPVPPPISSSFGQIRDESVCPQEPTMTAYIQGSLRAAAIIHAWRPA